MTTIIVKHFFDASHQLKDSRYLVTKACANLHGHTYAVETEIYAPLNPAGMVMDFKAIKQVIDRLDHKHINDVFKENEIDLQPTAENIAAVICKWISEVYPRLEVKYVKVCEGYKGMERSSWARYEP